MSVKIRSIARLGLLTAIALVLSYFERLIPLQIPIPGIKLGLSNTVLLYAIFLIGNKQAVLLMLLKVFIAGAMFSGAAGLLYSLAGGALSLIGMLLVKRIPGVSIIGVSITGAACHNIAQCLTAFLFLAPEAVLLYFPALLISAMITGAITGVIAKYVLHYLSWRNKK